MATDYTTDALIADVKRGACLPTSQNLFEEDDLVGQMSDDMKTIIVPLIMGAMEGYFLTSEEIPVTAGMETFETPWRAIGNKLQKISMLDADNNEYDLTRLDFHIEGNTVYLEEPESWEGETLKLYYYRRPNDLVPTSEAGKVTLINTGNGEVTITNVPANWGVTDKFDLITAKPPFKASAESISASTIASPVITFAPADLAGLSVGDWVCLEGQSTIPQIPYDAFPLLAQRGVCDVLGAISPQASQAAEAGYANLHKSFLVMISPRVDEAPKRFTGSNGIWRTRRGFWPRY